MPISKKYYSQTDRQILFLEVRKSYQGQKVHRETRTTMEELGKLEEINVEGVTCLLAAQMEALIER